MEFDAGGDYTKPVEDTDNALLGESLYARARLQFVRKVYAILCLQLLITVGVTCASMYSETFRNFQAEYYWIMYIMMVLMIVTEVAILCCKPGRRPPGNYILLLFFTLAESYMISFICAAVSEQEGRLIVLMAAIMTFGTRRCYLGIVVAATAYAMLTKEDFTVKWGLIVVVLMAMLQLLFFGLFWPTNSFLYSLYCTLGVVLFGIYLIIDTQMILGGKRIQLSVDEYVAAAMLLYIDIIQIFLYILSMLSKK